MNITREKYLSKIRDYYELDTIKVLTGVRRCGKSVLLKQIKEEIERNGINADHIISINFESLEFEKIRTPQKLNSYILKKIKDSQKYYIFLDEIQHVRSFEKVLASLKATQNVSIFVTGSNSKLLSGHLATLLVGRCVEFKIQPFSYKEFIDYHTENNLPLPNRPLDNYLRFGGFPERLVYKKENEQIEYLNGVFNGIVEKDICSTKAKIDREKFLSISQYIISNQGKEFSASKIAEYFSNINKSNLSRVIIYRYLDKMEKACLIYRVKRYDVASKRTLKNTEKQYVVDNGIRLLMPGGDSNTLTRNLEAAVYHQLLLNGYEVQIGKTYKGEVDFVVKNGIKKCYIQVAFSIMDEEVAKREFDAFKSIKDASPKYVLTLDNFDLSRDGIIHKNIEDYLKDQFELDFS